MLRAYSWLCAEGTLMAGCRVPYVVLGIKPTLATYNSLTYCTIYSPEYFIIFHSNAIF